MKPPYHPRHIEQIHGVASKNGDVTWSCSCGTIRATVHKLVNIPPGQPTIARLIADEMNAHRRTYVGAQR